MKVLYIRGQLRQRAGQCPRRRAFRDHDLLRLLDRPVIVGVRLALPFNCILKSRPACSLSHEICRVTAVLAGMVNSVAGGGTLLTFPAL